MEAIGTAARKQITGCANGILRRGFTPPESNKVEFLHALRSIREQPFQKNTILSTFRITGLFPFIPEIVLEPLRELEAPTCPTAPGPSPSSSHTPLTIRTLRRQANSLEEATEDLSPTYYSAEAWKICSRQFCASTARCAGSRTSSTHTSSSKSACCKATRWQTYLAGPRPRWSTLCI